MAKKITILAHGTRGDVQPAIALGKALQEVGYRVKLMASPNFQSWIEGHGLETAVSRINVQTVMESAGGQAWVEAGHKPLVQLRVMRQLIADAGWDMVEDAWHACQDADAIISSFTSDTYAYSIAEKLQVPLISLALQPTLIATRNGRSLVNAPLPARTSLINYLFGKLIIEPSPWQIYGDITNRFRQEVLNMPPSNGRENATSRRQTPMLLAYSPHVVPTPEDWPSQFHPCGYLFLNDNENWQPPAELQAFLDAGDPPICIGFGSMIGRNPEAITRLLIDAIVDSGQRAVFLSGWAGMAALDPPDTVFQLEAAPHSWLFPRMAAVVHHGGAGTTAAGLRAGVPAVIVPHMVDQPFWAKRLCQLGTNPEPIPRHKLTSSELASAIRSAVSDETLRAKASELGELVRAEDGVGTAVATIQQILMNDNQILEYINSINWEMYNGSPWYNSSQVASVLCSFIQTDNVEQSLKDCEHKVLSAIGNNHSGTYYPAMLSALKVIIYAARDHTNPIRCMCALAMLTDIYCGFAADIEGYYTHSRSEIETFVNTQIYKLKEELEQKRRMIFPTDVMKSITELLEALIEFGPDHRSPKPMPENNDSM